MVYPRSADGRGDLRGRGPRLRRDDRPSGILGPRLKWFVVGALIVLAVARVVPLSAVQLYVQGMAGIAALWPLAYAMWKHPEGRPSAQPHMVPA